MINETIRVLCTYLGTKCDYSDDHVKWHNDTLSLMILREVEYRLNLQETERPLKHNQFKLTLYLKPIESLTIEICNKMWKELNLFQDVSEATKDFIFQEMIKKWKSAYREEIAWLQKEGFYLKEELIEQYVILK
jgi:hypothetical protein